MTDGTEVSSRAVEVNRHGQVLLANVWPAPRPGATVWDDGGIVTQPPGQPPMLRQAINDRGQVAGIHGTPEGTGAAI